MVEGDEAGVVVQTAIDLKMIFTEFPEGSSQRGEILRNYFSGNGYSDEEKLRWVCAEYGMTTDRLNQLVHELCRCNYLNEFFVDPAALELLSYGVIAGPCEEFLADVKSKDPYFDNRVRFGGLMR